MRLLVGFISKKFVSKNGQKNGQFWQVLESKPFPFGASPCHEKKILPLLASGPRGPLSFSLAKFGPAAVQPPPPTRGYCEQGGATWTLENCGTKKNEGMQINHKK